MLNRKTFFIREHVGILKLSDTYDILDPETQLQIGIAKEKVSPLLHIFRFILNKQMLPTKIEVYEGDNPETGRLIFAIKRGFSIIRPRVEILSPEGQLLGSFKSKFFSIGGAFKVFDNLENEIALVKGDWKGWNFKFLVGENEIGTVTKKWSGIGKELFTTADNYLISLTGEMNQSQVVLLLAAGLAIDIVYKEK
ncbi:oxidoreductase [bacterium]|nr:oxidoreductase [bacterium]